MFKLSQSAVRNSSFLNADLSWVSAKTVSLSIASVIRSRIFFLSSSVAISVKVTTRISSTFNGREKLFSPAFNKSRRYKEPIV